MTGANDGPGERLVGYRFGPRDQRGLVAGVRTGQAVVAAAGLGLAVACANAVRGTLAVPVAGLVAAAGMAAAFAPIAGSALDEWLPVVARHLVGGLTGQRRHSVRGTDAPVARPAPKLLGDLSVVAVEPPSHAAGVPFGAIADRREHTLTGVLSIAGGVFALADRDDQDRRVAAWSSVLASLAAEGQGIVRLQWVARTVPDRPLARPAALALPEEAAPVQSYGMLLRGEPAGLRHEVLLGVTVRAPGARRRVAGGDGRRGGGDRRRRRAGLPEDRLDSADAVLARELATLERRLGEIGVTVEGALSEARLREALRQGLEPGPLQGPAPRRPWPERLEVGWSSVAVGGVVQRAYWISEWPRAEVGADFLSPLLLAAEDRRAVSVVMVPVPAVVAVRAVERARTSGAADAELRARHGFALTARTRHQHEAVVEREAELAAGHAAFRFSGYLAVTGTDEGALARACARVEQAAALARCSLRPLDGRQGEALTWCLPLGRGCG